MLKTKPLWPFVKTNHPPVTPQAPSNWQLLATYFCVGFLHSNIHTLKRQLESLPMKKIFLLPFFLKSPRQSGSLISYTNAADKSFSFFSEVKAIFPLRKLYLNITPHGYFAIVSAYLKLDNLTFCETTRYCL